MDYLITFTGHIDEIKRPKDGFPKIVQDLVFIRVPPTNNLAQTIAKAVNEYSAYYIKLQGMSVRPDAHAMEDFSIIDNGRMWVPMHMLTHFTAEVKQITGTMPIFNEKGDQILEEGETQVNN